MFHGMFLRLMLYLLLVCLIEDIEMALRSLRLFSLNALLLRLLVLRCHREQFSIL